MANEKSSKSVLTFEEWVEAVPNSIRNDPLWKSRSYQLALYLFDLVWEDWTFLKSDLRGREMSAQIIRSAGSISANIEEGYGRGTVTADHTRILRIALGEARETRGWYWRSRKLFPEEVLETRIELCDQIIALLVTTITASRSRKG
ncbi:MAG: four helix bundle protein [Chloroflexi bacterium]|nr:four helix bundle protein [Chloroflexota bacterium]